MENVFWYIEVVNFVQELVDRLDGDYEIVVEYEYLNCVFVVNKKFLVDGKWWIWIEYFKFYFLMKRFKESGGEEKFLFDDYMVFIFDWVVFGVEERGFDFKEERYFRKK